MRITTTAYARDIPAGAYSVFAKRRPVLAPDIPSGATDGVAMSVGWNFPVSARDSHRPGGGVAIRRGTALMMINEFGG